MEENLKLHVTSFESLYTPFLYFSVFSVILMYLLAPRTHKYHKHMQLFPMLTFIECGVQTILGRSKTSICELYMRFGSLVTFRHWVGSAPMIVVSNDYDLIKHMMNSPDDWIDRPNNALLVVRANGNQDRGILTSSGEVWKETRRYTMKKLSQLGLRQKFSLEHTTNEELRLLMSNLDTAITKTNNNVPIRNLFSLPTINVVWRFIGGTTFSADDPDFIEIVKANDDFTKVNFFQIVMADITRFFVTKATILFRFSTIYNAQKILKKHFTDVLLSRQLTVSQSASTKEEEENFTDSFLRQMVLNNQNNDNKMGHIFNLDNLIVTLFDLFEAGVDTTSNTLEIAVMHLAEHPHVQEKMQKEIQTVLGDRELSYYADKNNMNYTQAVINEVHRMASIVPLNFRGAARDCYLNDIFIEKGTPATINLYSIHYDEKFWGDPYNFRPERFLDSDGELLPSKCRRLLNFGAGKRVCLGESVATISVFTFLVGIIRKYKIEKVDANDVFGMEMTSSFTSRAKPFQARFIPLQD